MFLSLYMREILGFKKGFAGEQSYWKEIGKLSANA